MLKKKVHFQVSLSFESEEVFFFSIFTKPTKVHSSPVSASIKLAVYIACQNVKLSKIYVKLSFLYDNKMDARILDRDIGWKKKKWNARCS